ncbi:unnamed protein product [Brassicogethes aeneus]|uniref:Uncharacterized protein n=1 Tax=Brassicogethes aeneus TaxID=1431903 RepID=A0A9P0B4W0_BRAAE|nr:unnamed protein product [Brassicogethes aeneus]
MSDQQLKAAMKLIRNVCQPKFKTTDAQINEMHAGNWNQDRAGQCYTWCILNMYKLIRKDNSFDWEAGIKTLEIQAPDSIAEYAIPCVNECKDAVKHQEDKCVAGFEVAECIFRCNPEKYFLP